MSPIWLQQVQVLAGVDQPVQCTDVLLAGEGDPDAGALLAWGEAVQPRALALGLRPVQASGWILAPPLVDPHSVLEEPISGRCETLASLRAAAAAGGYGTVALLPWAPSWRDRPERLTLPLPSPLSSPLTSPPAGSGAGLEPLHLRLWGSFSLEGQDQELAPHADQLAAGAVGLAAGAELPPLALLERGLALGEMGQAPVLLAPRQASLAAGGFVREGVEALRAGWPLDPRVSELLPLQSLLALAAQHSGRSLCLMNLSTADAVQALRQQARGPHAPQATVGWWHLVADSGRLAPTEEGWRVVPCLGGPQDREALVEGLAEGVIGAVAVHHIALDAEEQLLPLDQRRAGVAGHGAPHGLVLPQLWQELVQERGWSIHQLWQVLSWGGSRLLGQEPERLQPGSRRWLLFDPSARWPFQPQTALSLAANQPLLGSTITGQVRATGLAAPGTWQLTTSAA